jgi:hypothetical protein
VLEWAKKHKEKTLNPQPNTLNTQVLEWAKKHKVKNVVAASSAAGNHQSSSDGHSQTSRKAFDAWVIFLTSFLSPRDPALLSQCPSNYTPAVHRQASQSISMTEVFYASSPNFDQPPPVLRFAAVYGNPDKSKLPLKETEPYSGLSPYAKSKWDMEVMSPRVGSWFSVSGSGSQGSGALISDTETPDPGPAHNI